jgi:hypothetical protein
MALLVGYTGNEYASSPATLSREMYYTRAVAVASGQATLIGVATHEMYDSPSAKLAVYNSSGSRIGLSDAFTVVAWDVNSVAISLSEPIVEGQVYYLGIIVSADDIGIYSDLDEYQCQSDTSGSYASPPTGVYNFADGAGAEVAGHLAIWVMGNTDVPMLLLGG